MRIITVVMLVVSVCVAMATETFGQERATITIVPRQTVIAAIVVTVVTVVILVRIAVAAVTTATHRKMIRQTAAMVASPFAVFP